MLGSGLLSTNGRFPVGQGMLPLLQGYAPCSAGVGSPRVITP
jgi:hypothetical protein